MSDDLISRQAAIEAILEDKIDSKSLEIMRVLGEGLQAQTLNVTCDRHAQIIKALPTAQERKKGKWLWVDGVRCSNCNYKLQTTGLPSFCPNCGAEME